MPELPRCRYSMAPERTRVPVRSSLVEREGVLHVHRGLDLPLSEVTWRATTSGGPGGQHANRTLSRVEVEFDVAASGTLGPRQRARLLERYGTTVRAAAAESRSQARNRERALERLAARIDDGLRVEPERRATRPTAAARARRVDDKRRRALTKRRRHAPRATTIDRPLDRPDDRFRPSPGAGQPGKPKGDMAGPRPESRRVRSSVSSSARGPRRAVSAA